MDKKFFFMAGLPRSGGTLMSSILNQNPDIYVSPQSVLPNTLGAAYNQYSSKENKDADQWDNIYRVMEMIIPTFYSGREEKYIIDKNFSWLEPHPYVILENHLKNPIKIICPVRNILEILASWDRLCKNDHQNKYDLEILKSNKSKISISDKRAEYFMEMGGHENGIRNSLHNMTRALYPEFKDSIMLVDYDNLMEEPEETIKSIYRFLDIPEFNHDFNNLSTPHEYTDHWGVKNHHKVKPSIQKEEYNLEEIFSQFILERYSGLEFWKNAV